MKTHMFIIDEKFYFSSIYLQTFLKVHGKSSHYMFQLKKCTTCDYCTVLQPPRVPDFEDLSFLPDPVPGEDGQYLDFFEVIDKTAAQYSPLSLSLSLSLSQPHPHPLLNMTHFSINMKYIFFYQTFEYEHFLVFSVLQTLIRVTTPQKRSQSVPFTKRFVHKTFRSQSVSFCS